MREHSLQLPDGRTVTFAEHGAADGTPVLWCHGGPGSRLEPVELPDGAAEAAGLRIVAIDRPGYGGSTPLPGRTIAGWVPEALVVMDHLVVDRFLTVGVSTGGAFALATAALAPARVIGVVACCAVSDMRDAACRATMSVPHAQAVWDAPDRESAMAAAIASHGVDGSKLFSGPTPTPLPAADLAMLADPAWRTRMIATAPVMFAQGVEGYTDDRIADGGGWTTFDVTAVGCPVIVLHGDSDVIADPRHARHTASIVPGAELRLVPGAGHFSIFGAIVPAVLDVVARAEGR